MHDMSARAAVLALILGATFVTTGARADHVIPDDLIVQGSTCTGLDCINNEDFDFDTLRLKENNLRIHFEDTSTAAGYPKNDWRIIANDSASGGASKFSIEDSTGGKTPFTITAGASTNSMFVDSSRETRLAHVVARARRAHQHGQHARASSRTECERRLGRANLGHRSNDANFFVRDVTGGSRLPFRIRPGAPTSSIDISASGNVGIGILVASIASRDTREDQVRR